MIAGLDVGTTGCKLVVFDLNGNQLYCSYRSYKTIRKDNKQEIDPLVLFEAVKSVLEDCSSKYEITAIGVDSFGEAMLLLDENDTPLGNIILQGDIRGQIEANELVNTLGKEKIESITALEPNYNFGLCKVMWVKKNKPELFAKTKRILMIEDFVIYMLTGNAVIDYSLAVRSLAFDINKLDWSDEILKAVGLNKSLFSKPQPLLKPAGFIKESIKNELNIKNNIIIAPSGHDQISVAIGTGIDNIDKAVDGAGTVECITPIFKEPINYKEMITNHLGIAPFFDYYTTYAYSYCCGCLIDWFRETFLHNVEKEHEFEILEKDFTIGPTNILVLPHFAGAAVPYMDPKSRGMIVGLSLENSLSNIYQSFLEGVAYEMRINMEILEKCNIKPNILVATGGGSNSKKWLQIKANILNKTIYVSADKEAGCKGGAIIAGIISGFFKDLKDGMNKMVKYKEIIKPNFEIVALYDKQFNKYKKLYIFMKGIE